MLRRLPLLIAVGFSAFPAVALASNSVWVSALDIGKTEQDWGSARADRSVEGRPIFINSRSFEHGVGTHAASTLYIDLRGGGKRFASSVGIDDEAGKQSDPVEFHVIGDGKLLARSKPLTVGQPAQALDVDVSGVKVLELLVQPVADGNHFCHADWADARIEFEGSKPITIEAPAQPSKILTPAAPPEPRVNGPRVFGVRPGHPFLYTIPATGKRPMTYGADGLPSGLTIDPSTGHITGAIADAGEFPVVLRASNAMGSAELKFRILVGEQISLTPPMGWNSWNCWGDNVTQEKILRSARAMASSGLIDHGWSFVNIDDAWQGARGGSLNAIQPDPKRFPDMKELCDEIHRMGLKAGIYSTPWVTSYAGRVGGSSEDPQGAWDPSLRKGPKNVKKLPFAIGHYHFYAQDAKQWAQWGIDYLKYDWAPNEVAETREMAEALRGSGRDVILSLSNNTTNSLFNVMPEMSKIANCWRIGGDITDTWGSIVGHGFNEERWAPFAGPGRWNDPDMFEVGANGGGHPKRLKPDEQYTHVSLWCLLSAPLLLGCDMDHLDPFTINLLTNDEVLAIDQDPLGRQAIAVARNGQTQAVAKDLDDGSRAVGLFNLGTEETICAANWADLKISGRQVIRDLWRQQDLGTFEGKFESTVPAHGVVLIRIRPVPN